MKKRKKKKRKRIKAKMTLLNYQFQSLHLQSKYKKFRLSKRRKMIKKKIWQFTSDILQILRISSKQCYKYLIKVLKLYQVFLQWNSWFYKVSNLMKNVQLLFQALLKKNLYCSAKSLLNI